MSQVQPVRVERRGRAPARRRPWAVCAVVACLGALGLEGVARWVFPIPGPGYAVWSLPPGSKVTLALGPDGFEAIHRYNRFGFRGADFPVKPRAGRRIACIGDSYTEGLGAAEQDTWPAALDRRLQGFDCEVLNLGCGGADTATYGRILCEAVGPLRPTDVIACLLVNDLSRGPRPAYTDRGALSRPIASRLPDPFRTGRSRLGGAFANLLPGWTYLVDRARGRWPVQTGLYWPRWSKEYVALAMRRLHEEQGVDLTRARYLVNQRIHDIDPRVLRASMGGKYHALAITGALVDPHFVYRVRVQDMRVPSKVLAEATRQWIAWFAAKCREAGIRPWVLFFPDGCLVCEGHFGPLKEDSSRDAPKVFGDTSVRDLLAVACQAASVPFIDPTDTLMRHRNEKLYHRYDTHPTGRAYELVAQVVAEAMQ